MQFNSFLFVLCFLPLTFFLYSIFRTSIVGKVLVFGASCLFYGWEHPWYLIPMFFTALLDYFMAQKIADTEDETKRKRYLMISIILNLSLMSAFKYTGWATESIVAAGAYLGVSLMTSPIHLPLPPGVSFYTFESISYTIDVYRREFKPRRHILDYLSFIVFFPHLVAGPIRRAKDLLPALSEYRESVSARTASLALFYILWGLFLKTVVADNCGGLVESVDTQIINGQGHLLPGVGLVFGYAFTFQIYGDFAAYSLIARGSALLFNIDVSRNFLTPYFSQNPSDFWQRWHISLSQWLRDYLYIPLGGNRFGTWMTLRNLVITMGLGGLWHGAGIFFLLWGLYHGLLLVLYRLFPIDQFLIRILGPIVGRTVAIVFFFHLIVFGWIMFRATPSTFPAIMESIFAIPTMTQNDLLPIRSVPAFMMYIFLIHAIPVMITDCIGYINKSEFPDLWSKVNSSWIKAIMALIAVYGIIFLGSRTANEFIYFAF